MTQRMLREVTFGAVLLGRVGKTQEEIATDCGVSRALVGHWRNGLRVPSEAHQARLEVRHSIPRSSWQEAPPAAVAARLGAQALRESNGRSSGSGGPSEGTRELALRLAGKATSLLDRIEQDEEASYRERAAVMTAVLQTLRLLAMCESDEEKLLRSPHWQRLEEKICEALQPFPEAADAVSKALNRSNAA